MEGTFQYMDNRNGHRFSTEVQLQHAATETRAQTNTDKTTGHSAIQEQTLTDSLALYKNEAAF